MLQVKTREWEITKAYIYDVALLPGLINLDWDDFKAYAERHRPVVAVINDGDAPVNELAEQAMAEMQRHFYDHPSNLIVSLSYSEGEELTMDEMGCVSDCLRMLADEKTEIKWGVSQNNSLKCKRCISVFAFE